MRIKKVERPFHEGNIMVVGCDGIVKIKKEAVAHGDWTYTSYRGLDKDGNAIMEFVNGEFDIEYFKNNEQ